MLFTPVLVCLLSAGLTGLYIPLLGKRILWYRKIVVPPCNDHSVFLAIIASIGMGIVFLQIDGGLPILQATLFLFLLLLIGWMDWYTGLILDQLTFGGMIVFIAIQLLEKNSDLPFHLLGSLMVYLLLYGVAAWTNKLGYGDVKLMAMCACILDWQLVFFALWSASISGILFVIFQIVKKQPITRSQSLPFGPHLALGSFISYLYGEQILGLFFH